MADSFFGDIGQSLLDSGRESLSGFVGQVTTTLDNRVQERFGDDIRRLGGITNARQQAGEGARDASGSGGNPSGQPLSGTDARLPASGDPSTRRPSKALIIGAVVVGAALLVTLARKGSK